MPSPAHETLVTLLRDAPARLDRLLQTLGLAPLPPCLHPDDPTLRVANPVEVRPDLLLVEGDTRGAWVLVEVQQAIDPDKQRRWLAATALLLDARGTMGDLVVITQEAHVAAWARNVAQATGPSGTHLALHPRVVLLSRSVVARLLAAADPELAVMATWAVHDQKGRAAKAVVRAAFIQVASTADPALREALLRAMISMLDDDLLHVLRELMMLNTPQFPVNPAFERLRAEMEAAALLRGKTEGKAEGRAEAVIAVLQARGIPVDDTHRARILACTELDTLDRWLVGAVTAPSAAALFDDGA